jgi:acyl-CoA hydrolase
MPRFFDDVNECVDAAIRRTGRRVVLALPLGLGKPIAVANEFWRRALRDATLDLTIVTALSLRRPVAASDLERRLLGPLTERVFGDYQDPDWLEAQRRGPLPANMRVIEFFLEPGSALTVPAVQQNYLSANYTHVARALAQRGVNVIAQLIARRTVDGVAQYSLGANADVTPDLLPLLAPARAAGQEVVVIGQVHPEMPFMLGAAQVEPATFDCILEHPRYDQRLFCPPNPSLSLVDHAIGLHVSALVRDGGTLQVGIGELGDAVCYALLLRHQQNDAWRQALRDAGTERSAPLVDAEGGRAPFSTGLFASTEMFVDQLLDLYRAGILRRRVYDSLALSRLIACGNIGDRFDERILQDLPHAGIGPRLDAREFAQLQHFGVFRAGCRYENGRIRTPEGEWIDADLADADAIAALARHCLGRELRNGCVLHAGFFVGPRGFYAALRELPDADLRQFDLRGVGYVNQLYGPDHELRTLQRRSARFVNTTMMVTLLGAAISDTLEDGRVVSGVGGQYNFVSMAHALPDARSILCVRAARYKGGVASSNLVAGHGNATIPRHLRDIVVSEYGIADLRGRTDAECIAALLAIADSRFQPQLLREAQRAGKIASSHAIPEAHRGNTPQRLERALATHRAAGLFSEYPFGTDLSDVEVDLARALRWLQRRSSGRIAQLRLALAALLNGPASADEPALQRMQLDAPIGHRERLQRRLVALGLRATRAAAPPTDAHTR